MAGISAEDYVWDVGREGVPVPLPISSGTSRRGLVTLYPCSIVLGFSGWLSRVRWAYALYLCQPMISGLVIPRGVALSYRPSTIPPLRFGFMFSPNPPKDTDGRREDSGRGWVRELQGRWPGVLG